MSRWRNKRAAVLGCGPAGLFATHALISDGWSVDVYSNRRKSHMFGAQYLHSPIPELSEGDGETVRYLLRGTVEDYRTKVYGVGSSVQVSPESLTGDHPAWDIRAAYDFAWDAYSGLVIDRPGMDYTHAYDILQASWYKRVISSLPAPSICARPGSHVFSATRVWAIGDAPERGIISPLMSQRMTVECNGDPAPRWYRMSNVFGHATVEWPYEPKPPVPGIAEVVKPTSTTCDCWADRIERVGRYGIWQKGVLSHSAYYSIKGLK